MSRLTVLAAAALLAASSTHAAGPAQRRLLIEIEMQREASFTGVESGKSRLVQTIRLDAVLATDGTPMLSNPLDPDDTRRQMERAQRTQNKIQAAQKKYGSAPPADPQAMLAMQSQAQAMMAKCGQDRDCLMREATAFSAAQVGAGHPQAQAKLQAYGNAVQACERQHKAAAQRDACIANARRQAGGSDETDTDDEVETPYLHFNALGACQFETQMKIDERIDGSYGDVQGIVPFTETRQAEGRDRFMAACSQLQVVLDTRNGRVWTLMTPALRGAPGTRVRTDKGRKPQQDSGLQEARFYEAMEWLNTRQANLSASGSDRLQRMLPGGKLDVKLRWSFAPL